MRKKLFAGAGLAAVACLASCSQPQKADAPPARAAVPVVVAAVVRKNVPITVQSVGTGEALSNVQIEPQVSGELVGVAFKQGDFVRKGQLLFRIDPAPFQAALDQAKGNLEKDSATAQINAVTAARYKQLYQEGVVSRQQYDQYQSQADSAQAQVAADKAAVETATLQLSYCQIYSPMEGKTGALGVFPGNLVKANSTPVLVTINQINPIYVDFSVPENLLGQVRQALGARAPVQATSQADPSHPEIGHLSFVDNTVDPTTGTIKLKATFANLDHRLWPGEFLTVNLRLGEEANATVVPALALQTGQQGDYVWVVGKDNTAQMQSVTVKQRTANEVVVGSGVAAGDWVVTEGQLRLVPGAKVQIASRS